MHFPDSKLFSALVEDFHKTGQEVKRKVGVGAACNMPRCHSKGPWLSAHLATQNTVFLQKCHVGADLFSLS